MAKVRDFERDFLKHMNEQRPEIAKAIAQTLDLADELRQALTAATREFKKNWLATAPVQPPAK